jgi:hypothetical protein
MDKKVTRYLLLAAILPLLSPQSTAAGEPTEEVRAAVNRGVEILNSAKTDGGKEKAETIGRLKQVV